MANRPNRARALGPGIGSAAANTDNALYVDLGSNEYAEAIAGLMYLWTGGAPVAWNGAVTVDKSATGTVTSVASSNTNVTLLAANTSRVGAAFYNESTQVLYLKLGATASATSYTVQVNPGGYYELPVAYTGIVDGIWASANGNLRVTELT